MKWEHDCDLAWLKERQRYLTASDIKSLVPYTKTGRPRKIGDEDYLKVWAGKQRTLTQQDCHSTGAAARGHMLEPYAISALNECFRPDRLKFHHWDDKLVHREGCAVAWSPDGMDIPMQDDVSQARNLVEVKCYSTENHVRSGWSDKKLLEERWQIATAMYVTDSIENAYLVFFDPRLQGRSRMFVFSWRREELQDEMLEIANIEKSWLDFDLKMTLDKPKDALMFAKGIDEEMIAKQLEERARLNP